MGTESIAWTGKGQSDTTSWSRGQHGPVDVWLFSTPPTIEIINTPELVGVPFQRKLLEGLTSVLRVLSTEPEGIDVRGTQCDVLYVLRGGLNFSLHDVLSRPHGKEVEVSFQSSQRTTDDEGRLLISEDTYSKWNLQDRSVLFIGDICATGTTMDRAIGAAALEHSKQKTAPKTIVVVTIGTGNLLEVLQRQAASCRVQLGQEVRLVAVYLEGIFSLFSKHELLSTTHLPATDFLRKSAARSLALEAASLADPRTLLERCAIYDGGSRAFEPRLYRRNLQAYWERVSALSHSVVVRDFFNITTDMLTYEQPFGEWRRSVPWWKMEDDGPLRAVHSKGSEVVANLGGVRVRDLASQRLDALNKH